MIRAIFCPQLLVCRKDAKKQGYWWWFSVFFWGGFGLLGLHFGLFGLHFVHFGLLGFHFLSFCFFGASFPFLLAFWAFRKGNLARIWSKIARFRLTFAVFPFQKFAALGFILVFWIFISFHFGLLGFHFLSFWPFRLHFTFLPSILAFWSSRGGILYIFGASPVGPPPQVARHPFENCIFT